MIGDFDRRRHSRRGKSSAKKKKKAGTCLEDAWLEFCSVQQANGMKPMPAFVMSQMKTFFAIGYMPAALSGYKAIISICEKLADLVMDLNGPEDDARLSRKLCAMAEEAGLAIQVMLAEYKMITDKTQQELNEHHAAMAAIQKKCEKLSQN
jgi:putative aminopeptidase FrvX